MLFFLLIGEVMIWDLSQEDECLIINSAMQDETHQEPISKVC